MAKQIIRLTESDLHGIIRESVKRILREQDEEPTREELEVKLADAIARVKKFKGKSKYRKEWLEAAQEAQKLKEMLGKCKISVIPPGASGDEENEKRGIPVKKGLRRTMGDGDMVKRREEDKIDREGLKGIKANDIDDILGQ